MAGYSSPSGGFEPAKAGTPVTVHTGFAVTVPSKSYSTVFDINGPAICYGGTLHSESVGLRLTVDGDALVDERGSVWGSDSGGDNYGVRGLPIARSEGSMKLEIYNTANNSQDMGYHVQTVSL